MFHVLNFIFKLHGEIKIIANGYYNNIISSHNDSSSVKSIIASASFVKSIMAGEDSSTSFLNYFSLLIIYFTIVV